MAGTSFFKPARLIAWLWVLFLVGVVFNLVFFWAVSTNFLGLFGTFPGTDKLINPKSELATEVYTEDMVLIGKYFRENRAAVKFEDISPNLIKALYATEDIRFDEHSGIDLQGVLGLFWAAIKGNPRGGSTITQQLAKNLFDTRGEEYNGKLHSVPGLRMGIIKAKEWIVAVRLEQAYTKKEIITMYLNTVNFGNNAFGIKVAAQTFFGTTPDKLKPEEAAVLVGVLKGPSQYNPFSKNERTKVRAVERRNTVLDQMVKYGYLTDADGAILKAKPIDVRRFYVESHNDGNATYFRAELKRDLQRFCRERGLDLYSDGLKVYTTINSKLQTYAEQAMSRHMKKQQEEFFKHWGNRNPWCDENGKEIPNFIENAAKRSERYKAFMEELDGDEKAVWKAMNTPVRMRVFTWDADTGKLVNLSPVDSIRYYKKYLHAGLLSVDPKTGYIKAWVGGINFRYFKYDHVRQGRRQPGSSFKPILYAASIENGYGPCYEMVDAPVTFHNDETGQDWTPKNSDGSYSGERMTLRRAMGQSINSVAAGMLKQIGIGPVLNMARRLGVTSKLDSVYALCLGVSDVSLYELVGAYATFVNHGQYTAPSFIRRIEDKNGNVLLNYVPVRRDDISSSVAYKMVHMLRGSTTERNGTALGLHRLGKTLQGNEVGAKTGTTSNYSDGWFVGCTKDLVTGIWVGGDDRSIHFRSSNLGQGARMAMPIWSYYMDAAYEDATTGVTKGPFEKPLDFSPEWIDCKLQKLGAGGADSTLLNQYVVPKSKDLKDEF